MTLRRDITPARRGRDRRIDEIRNELGADDRAVLDEWLVDARISADRIAKELGDDGHRISVGAIAGYRYHVLGVGNRSR